MRDIVNNIGAVQVVAPAVLSATNTSRCRRPPGLRQRGPHHQYRRHRQLGDFTAKLQESDTTTAATSPTWRTPT